MTLVQLIPVTQSLLFMKSPPLSEGSLNIPIPNLTEELILRSSFGAFVLFVTDRLGFQNKVFVTSTSTTVWALEGQSLGLTHL